MLWGWGGREAQEGGDCCCPVAQSCPTLCNPIDCSTPGFQGVYHLPELAQTHVHLVGDAIQPSLPLWSPSLPAIISSIRDFSNESVLRIRWPKYCSFSFSIFLSNEHSGLISFRIDWFDLLQSKGLSRVFSNTTVQKYQFFRAKPSLWSNSYIHTQLLEKTIALTFAGRVMSLLFNTLSRFVIASLPKSKCLLISWLQSPSAVILEPKKIKCLTVSIFSPTICHEIMGPDAMIFVF